MRYLALITWTFLTLSLNGQELPLLLQKTKEKIESVEQAEGEVTLNVDVDFINMPEKTAQLSFEKGKPVSYTSDNFIFIPKRGLDFSWSNLFDVQFITVDRGQINQADRTIQVYNIIPDDKKADFAIMTIKVDVETFQIVEAEISTKSEGTYLLKLNYTVDQALPAQVIASFELEKVRIPLNFMGKDTELDRQSMKSEGEKTGTVYLDFDWKVIKP